MKRTRTLFVAFTAIGFLAGCEAKNDDIRCGSPPEEDDAFEQVKTALEWYKDPNITDENAHTFLHRAAANGHDGIATFLISQGADVNAKNTWGYTPLHWAAAYDSYHISPSRRAAGQKKIAVLLISSGARVNARSHYGWTPLHVAVQTGFYDIAEVFLAGGVNVNAKGPKDLTPLHMLVRNGCRDESKDGEQEYKGLIQRFVAKGAQVTAMSELGTVLDLAEELDEADRRIAKEALAAAQAGGVTR